VVDDVTSPVGTSAGGSRTVKSAARVLEVLEELASSGPRPMRELADELGVPRSSMYALLRTLQDYGWLESDASGTRYGLGITSLLVGSAYVDGDRVVERTAAVLDQLAEASQETVHLGRLAHHHVVYLAKRESPHPLRMHSSVGRRLPAYATGLGKAILATMPPSEVVPHLPKLMEARTPRTLTDPEALAEELARTRARGYAVDDEESLLGLRCFAVALPGGVPTRDAISVSVPMFRLDRSRQDDIIHLLLEARGTLAP
jgi:DNA-binding IclR family transcriptional regulator